MAANFTREVRLQKEIEAWALRQRCWTLARIAGELQIDESTVSRMLQRATDRYTKTHEADIERIKTEQVAQLSFMADEAVQGWERSKEASKATTVRQSVIQNESIGGVSDVTKQAKDQDGDPRYLAEARACLADIRKIVGADAPTKQEISGPDNGAIPVTLVDYRAGITEA